jgi:hypothetical protein
MDGMRRLLGKVRRRLMRGRPDTISRLVCSRGTVETSARRLSHKEQNLIERAGGVASRFVADASSIVPMASAMTVHRACRT